MFSFSSISHYDKRLRHAPRMSHTYFQMKCTDLMDQYGALTEAHGYCNKLFEDASKEFRMVQTDVKAKKILVDHAERILDNHIDMQESIPDECEEYNKGKKKRDRDLVMQECVVEKKTLERHERNLAIKEGEQCVVEKKRWDSFIGLAKISKKREDILDDALRLELQLRKEVDDAEKRAHTAGAH